MFEITSVFKYITQWPQSAVIREGEGNKKQIIYNNYNYTFKKNKVVVFDTDYYMAVSWAEFA